MTKGCSETIDWPMALETHRSWLAQVLRCRIGDAHAVEDALQEIALTVLRQHPGDAHPGDAHPGDAHPGDALPVDALPVDSPGDAEEQQQTSGRASSNLPQDPDKVAPWLYRVAVRQAVNFHRKANRKSAPQPMAELSVEDSSRQPLDWLVSQEQRQQFESAMQQLTPAQREILTLKYVQKWNYQQLSDHLGIPVRSVEYRLLQARNQLRKNLTKVDPD